MTFFLPKQRNHNSKTSTLPNSTSLRCIARIKKHKISLWDRSNIYARSFLTSNIVGDSTSATPYSTSVLNDSTRSIRMSYSKIVDVMVVVRSFFTHWNLEKCSSGKFQRNTIHRSPSSLLPNSKNWLNKLSAISWLWIGYRGLDLLNRQKQRRWISQTVKSLLYSCMRKEFITWSLRQLQGHM